MNKFWWVSEILEIFRLKCIDLCHSSLKQNIFLSSESLESNLHRQCFLCSILGLSFLTISVQIYCGREIIFMNWKIHPNLPVPVLDRQWTIINWSWLEASAKFFSQKLKYVFPVMLGVLEKYIFVGKRLIFWSCFLCLSFPSLNMKQGERKQEIKIHRRKKCYFDFRIKGKKQLKV